MTQADDDTSSSPAGPTGLAAAYLERLVFDSFKRELDQDENVVRSLPFFATSIGVLVAFAGLARGALPGFSFGFWPLLVYGLLACLLLCLIGLLWFLFQAVRPREFNYPMAEAELIDYATELTTYYQGIANTTLRANGDEGDPTELAERAVVDDIRAEMLRQMARAAGISRANNLARLRARGRAFLSLMVSLSFAVALIAVILGYEVLRGLSHG